MAVQRGFVGDLRRDAVRMAVELLHAEPGVRAAVQEVRDRLAARAGDDAAVVVAEESCAVVAGADLRGRAVRHVLLETLVIGEPLQRRRLAKRQHAVQVRAEVLVIDFVRRREDAGEIRGQRLHRGGAGVAQRVVHAADPEVHLGAPGAPSEVGVQPVQVGVAGLAKAAVVGQVQDGVEREGPGLPAELEDSCRASIGAAVRGHGRRRIGEAVLQPDADGAAERIEAEQRIGRLQVDGLDRRRRNQVPVDGIAERVVEARAIDVDRKALRRPRDRGRGEAAEQDVRLEDVALGVVDGRRRDVREQRAGQAGYARAIDVGGNDDLRGGRHAVALDVGARQRRAADDQHARQAGRGNRFIRCAPGLRRRDGAGQQHDRSSTGGAHRQPSLQLARRGRRPRVSVWLVDSLGGGRSTTLRRFV